MTNKPKCETCQAWRIDNGMLPEFGNCCQSPPIIGNSTCTSVNPTLWPITHKDQVCMQHIPIADPKSLD